MWTISQSTTAQAFGVCPEMQSQIPDFFGIGRQSAWWTATKIDSESAYNREVYLNEEGLLRRNRFMDSGYSVRLIRDIE